MRLGLWLLLGAIGIAAPAFAQGARIAGRVVLTEPTRRQAVEGRLLRLRAGDLEQDALAVVTLLDGQGAVVRQSFADATGAFAFDGLEPLRKYELRVARPGFSSVVLEAAALPDRPTEVSLRLPQRKTMVWYFLAGGELMWALLLISVFTLYVVLERAFILLWWWRSGTAELLERVRAHLVRKDVKGALGLCAHFRGPVGRVLRAGLYRHGASRAEVERAMEISAGHQVARLERGLAVLAGAAGLAPMVGFLGTVVGMIVAFDAIAEHGLGDPSYVAEGISIALITTAAGLLVALVALPAYHFFHSRIAVYVREMETAANLLLETFERMERDAGDSR